MFFAFARWYILVLLLLIPRAIVIDIHVVDIVVFKFSQSVCYLAVEKLTLVVRRLVVSELMITCSVYINSR